MPVEEIIKEIKKQDAIIDGAQAIKKGLYQKLLDAGTEEFDLITVKEAARILDVSLATIYSKINNGQLRTRHICSSVRVYKSEILKIDDK